MQTNAVKRAGSRRGFRLGLSAVVALQKKLVRLLVSSFERIDKSKLNQFLGPFMICRPWAPRPPSAVFRYPHGKIGGAEFAVLAPQAQRSGGTVVRI
jgi:hypothetical protein